MDDYKSIMIKLQQILATLQLIEIKASGNNLRYMLASQNSIEEVQNDILSLSEERTKGGDSDECDA